MTATVAGSGTFSVPQVVTSEFIEPSSYSLQVPVTVTDGDWIVACVSWRQFAASANVGVWVGDDTGSNFWDPVGTSTSTGVVRSAIWVAPAAWAPSHVLVAPSAGVAALGVVVYDVAGMSKWVSVVGPASARTNAGTSVAASLSAPASAAIVFTTSTGDNVLRTITLASGGWGSTTQVSGVNGWAATGDITTSAAFKLTSSSSTGTWNASGSLDLSTCIAGFLQVASAPAQVNPAWPVTVLECSPGEGPGTPSDQLAWVPLATRSLSMTFNQGRQYQLASLSTGSGQIDLDNPDGALVPPGTGSLAGIDSGTPIRMRMIWPSAAKPYGVPFSGYCQKWPQQWDAATQRGHVSVATVDAWNYANGNLQPALLQETLLDSPYAVWPCTDIPGASIATNAARGNQTPLNVVRSKYGAGAATEGFGANSSAILGAQGTLILTASQRTQSQSGMWGQQVDSSMGYAQGYSLITTDAGFPRLSGNGVTVEGWFQYTGNISSQVRAQILSITNTAGTSGFYIQGNTPGAALQYTYTTAAGVTPGGAPFTIPASADNQANPVYLVVELTNTAVNIWVNGNLEVTDTFSGALLSKWTRLAFSDAFTKKVNIVITTVLYTTYSGSTGFAAVYNGPLPQGRISTHWLAGKFGLAGEPAASRIERLLQGSLYGGRRVIMQETGAAITPMASCQDTSGQPASASVTNIAQSTVPGYLVVTPAGELLYRAKQYVYNQPIKWRLGDRPDLGEIPYASDFLIDYDPTRTVNDVQITQLDNQDVVLPATVINQAASQAQYGDNTYWATGYCQNDFLSPLTAGPGCLDLANWIATTNIKPLLRPATVTVDASSFNNAWPLFMQGCCGDMVTVTRRVPTSGLTYTFTGRISQTERSLTSTPGATEGTITMTIDPVPEISVLSAGDATHGKLDGTNILAW